MTVYWYWNVTCCQVIIYRAPYYSSYMANVSDMVSPTTSVKLDRAHTYTYMATYIRHSLNYHKCQWSVKLDRAHTNQLHGQLCHIVSPTRSVKLDRAHTNSYMTTYIRYGLNYHKCQWSVKLDRAHTNQWHGQLCHT